MSSLPPNKASGPAKAVPKVAARRKQQPSSIAAQYSIDDLMEGQQEHEVGGRIEPNAVIQSLTEVSGGHEIPGVTESEVTTSLSSSTNTGDKQDFDYSDLLNNPRKTTLHNNKSGVVLRLQNIVTMFSFGCSIPLRELASKAKNAEYNPRRFMALILRLRNPAVTVSIFESGKVVITGAKMESEAHQAARKITRMVQMTVCPEAALLDFGIHNILASADLKFPVALDRLLQDHQDYATYEPEIFPALVYRLMEPKACAMIFVTGRIVLTGCKSREDMYHAFEIMYSVLKEYRKMPTKQVSDYV